MDAYDLYHEIHEVWLKNVNIGSGNFNKMPDNMKACVWTSEGYKEIAAVRYNEELKLIELELED
jgi:hypothetical protein